MEVNKYVGGNRVWLYLQRHMRSIWGGADEERRGVGMMLKAAVVRVGKLTGREVAIVTQGSR